MNSKDLISLLDLDGVSPGPPGDASVIHETRKLLNLSPTALELDAWGLRRGRDLVAESDRLRQSGTDEFVAADFFAAAFDPIPDFGIPVSTRSATRFSVNFSTLPSASRCEPRPGSTTRPRPSPLSTLPNSSLS